MSGEPQAKRTKMSALDYLKQYSVVVADTGDFEGIISNTVPFLFYILCNLIHLKYIFQFVKSYF